MTAFMKEICMILFLLSALFVQSQTKTDYFDKFIVVSYSQVDTANAEVNAMIHVWTSYLKSRLYGMATKNDTLGSRYWNDEEKQRSSPPDHISAFFPGLFYFQTTILSVEPIDDHYYRILNCSSAADSTGRVDIKAVYYVLVKRINNRYKLYNYFHHEKEKLMTTLVGTVRYYYPGYFPFSMKEAGKLAEFRDSLSVLFHEPGGHELIYVIDTNAALLVNRLGFIYQPMLSGSKDGRYMETNGMLLSSFGENHRHEVVHSFTSHKHSEEMLMFNEGLATLLGGSRGHDMKWHANNLYNYFVTKMNSDTSKIMSLSSLYKQTPPEYIKGAIIMKYAIDIYGFEKALKLLTYSERQSTPEEVIEKELGISKDKLNPFMLKYMKKYAGL